MPQPSQEAAPVAAMSPELQAFYGNRPLMWRNLLWLTVLNGSWTVVYVVLNPLMILRMNEIGMREGMIGNIASINGYAVSFLVMYFSWKSDHTVTRWGRRIPYLWISAPGIFLALLLFPLVTNMWIMVGVLAIHYLFMDCKASTISLLGIDLVPRYMLARAGWLVSVVPSLLSFFALRFGMNQAESNIRLPFFIGVAILAMTSLAAGNLIKEPPVRTPQTEPFKPWSALKVGWEDRRRIVLMLAASLIVSTTVMYYNWIWLFARNTLNLTRSDMGSALSWVTLAAMPLGLVLSWLIDRVNLYRLAGVYVVTQLILCVSIFFVHDKNGLIALSFVQVCGAGLGTAASMILWRSMPPHEVGSITSTAAFINNAYVATLVGVSGQLIQRLGSNYAAALVLGFCMTLCGFVLLLVYRRLTASETTASADSVRMGSGSAAASSAKEAASS